MNMKNLAVGNGGQAGAYTILYSPNDTPEYRDAKAAFRQGQDELIARREKQKREFLGKKQLSELTSAEVSEHGLALFIEETNRKIVKFIDASPEVAALKKRVLEDYKEEKN